MEKFIMVNEFSVEDLISIGTGLVSNKKETSSSIEGYDGYEDGIFAEVTRSEETLKFLDTMELMERKSASDKMKMLKKISNSYNRRTIGNAVAANSIESFINTQVYSLESGENGFLEKIKKFFKTIGQYIVKFFKSIVAFVEKIIFKIRTFFNGVMYKLTGNEKYAMKIIELSINYAMKVAQHELAGESYYSTEADEPKYTSSGIKNGSTTDVINSGRYAANNYLNDKGSNYVHFSDPNGVKQNIDKLTKEIGTIIAKEILPKVRYSKKNGADELENLHNQLYVIILNDPKKGEKCLSELNELIIESRDQIFDRSEQLRKMIKIY